ncbi:MAG TPA: phosphoribosylanthranilate isomerase [Bacteroidota bacterium]|jgi:phosphoribosylanthranilate isomerase
MKLRVKICGIRDSEDAQMCSSAGADALGFIFYTGSPRYVDPDAAAAIIRELPPFITPVGVFVNAGRETIQSVIRRTGIRAIQLSGDETPADCQGYPLSVVKAFRIRNIDEVERVKEYAISAAMLDGASGGPGIRPDGGEPTPGEGHGASVYGGSGTMPDLSVAERLKNYYPLIVAGGLNPENAPVVVRAVKPYAIDVNSGVESAPGKKDRNKVKLLFEALGTIE